MLQVSTRLLALANSGDLGDLKKALQAAVELEHSTMPPYLYALFSLGAENRPVARVLREIAREEMLHMLLAANLLRAIGGTPVIASSDFVPAYPTHLPGTVAGDLVVPLKPFSKALTEQVFMRIEEPETPLNFRAQTLGALAPARTIGEFYRRIRQTFAAGGADALIVDKAGDLQPVSDAFDVPQKVTSAAAAIAAIDVIVDQGEGTATDPHVAGGGAGPASGELAHYYRFAELVKGRLKPNPAATALTPAADHYIYDASDPVPFDAARVLPLLDNPRGVQYAAGSPARAASEKFNRIYTQILTLLQQAFTTDPLRLDDAIGLMMQLTTAAQDLTAIDLGNGSRAGPTFEYTP